MNSPDKEPNATQTTELAEIPKRGLISLLVGRPVGTLVLFVTLIVLGLIAYRDIPLQLMPSGFASPSLNVYIPHSDSSAVENEEKVARPIEEQLRTLSGIEEVTSRSNSSRVYMRVRFDPHLDLDLAKAEVRDRIERARPQFPPGVDRISMWSEDADQVPLAFMGVLFEGGLGGETDYLLEKIVTPRLEGTHGVSKVDIWGALQDSVRILLDEDRVAAANMDLGDLIRRLAGDNFAQPLGEIDDGGRRVILRSDMRFESLEEIENYPVRDGLRIGDLGEVVKVKSVREWLSRIDGKYSYTALIRKDSQVNIVDATEAMRATIAELEQDPRLDGKFKFQTFWAPGDMVQSSLGQLVKTALWGGALALVVLFIFLRRVRLTVCVAASIPVSALMAVMFEYFIGGSFNVLTMTGITLGIGMLVDNSVVVVENIARYREAGHNGLDAARLGAREISLAVTLATLTSVVVFLPLIYISDIPSLRLMLSGIGRPLCISLLASLGAALIFLPVITGRILGERPAFIQKLGRRIAPLTGGPAGLFACIVGALRMLTFGIVQVLHRINRALLTLLAPLFVRIPVGIGVAWLAFKGIQASSSSMALGERVPGETEANQSMLFLMGSMTLVAVILIWIGMAYWRRRPKPAPARPASFIPRDRSIIGMIITSNRLLVGWTMRHRFAATVLSGLAFITIVIPFGQSSIAAFGQEEDTTSIRVYVDFEADFTSVEAEREISIYEDFFQERKERFGFETVSCRYSPSGGRLEVYWKEVLTTERYQELLALVKQELPKRPGHKVQFHDGESTNRRLKHIAFFTLTGPDSTTLERLGLQALEVLESVPGLSGVSSPLESSPEQLEVAIDRDKAVAMGVSTEVAQNTIAYILRGSNLSRYYEDGRELPLLLEFDSEKVAGIETLRDMSIWTENGRVALSSISDISVTKGDQSIFRRNGQTNFTITAEVDDPTQVMAVTMAGNAALKQIEMPRGYSVSESDSAFSRGEEEFASMLNALALSVVLVFLLMSILFESVLLPFSVMFTIPFAILGAMWTIYISGTQMDSMGWIGMIILAGVVVNNGIVLIDRIHNLVNEGMDRTEAVILGCSQRVRPVLMTALTTVSGLLPMAIVQPGTNSISYQALAVIVAGGLVTSTFFTLWVVPLAYSLLDDLSKEVQLRTRWVLRAWKEKPLAGGEDALGPVPN